MTFDCGKRRTGTGLYKVMVGLGLQAGLRVRPHGLRHAAITSALDRTNRNIRAVQKFSRHRDLRVLNVVGTVGQTSAGGSVTPKDLDS